MTSRPARRDSTPPYPIGTVWERTLDLVFPPSCVGCRKVGRWICSNCWTGVDWHAAGRCRGCGALWPQDTCFRCSGTDSSLDSLVAITHFTGTAREAVHGLKYHGHHAISSMMGRLMAGAVTEFPIDKVVPVPLHAARRRERGYDQAALLACQIATTLELYHDPHALRRLRRTRQQVELSGEVRRRNVVGAFEARDSLLGQTVLLVDDVVTTGATMLAAAAAARAAGAARVQGIAFASALDRDLIPDEAGS
ncbi:MAG TPA: ComF family protein [Chloroflexota bacterium]|nr:ComF family protein [Chloroflexota bacterium]